MAAPIEIGALREAEAADLVHALAARGLIGKPERRHDAIWLEVHEAHEETERLLGEVTTAVAEWLADQERATLELRVGSRVETVAARGDLRDALRARASASARPRKRRT
jgi:hypothetical protein